VRLPAHRVQQDVTVAIVPRVLLDNLEVEMMKTVLFATIVRKVGTKMYRDKQVVYHVFQVPTPATKQKRNVTTAIEASFKMTCTNKHANHAQQVIHKMKQHKHRAFLAFLDPIQEQTPVTSALNAQKGNLLLVLLPPPAAHLKMDSSQDPPKQGKLKSRSGGPLNARAKVTKKCVLVQFVVQREHLKSIISVKYV